MILFSRLSVSQFLENWQHQSSSPGNTVGTERLQEKTGTTKEELGRRHQTRPQTDRLDLGISRGTGGRQSRLASTCGQCSHLDAGWTKL